MSGVGILLEKRAIFGIVYKSIIARVFNVISEVAISEVQPH